MYSPSIRAIWFAVPLLIVGCGTQKVHENHAQARGSYMQDAEACWGQNPQMESRTQSTDSDHSEERYLECLRGRGYQQSRSTDPLLVAIKRCRSEGVQVFSARGETYLASSNTATMDGCLRARGFKKPESITSRLPRDTVKPDSKESKNQAKPLSDTQSDIQTVIIPPRH